jgi:4-hydroxyphenylpyruvate dioxygenase
MELSISTSLLYGSIEDKIKQVADAGFQAIDINTQDIICSDLNIKSIRNFAEQSSIKINKYQPFYDLEGSSEKNIKFKKFEYFLTDAKAIGASIILLGSSCDIKPSIERSILVDDLKKAAELAAKFNLKIAYLAMPWSPIIHTTEQAYEMVKSVDHDAFGLAINSYFALADGSKPAKFREIDGSKIFSVQLADAPLSKFDISKLKHEFACLPGLGDLNLPSFIKSLIESGYEGSFSLARMGRKSGLGEFPAINGIRALLNVIDKSRENIAPEVEDKILDLPRRAKLKGVEFLEFTLDATSADDFRTLLKTLCFRKERKHVNKPVEFWRQGAINIVLNVAQSGFAKEALDANGPGLCDLGLRVEDAHATKSRAEAFYSETFSQTLGDGELDIPAIHSIGHSLIHFIDEKSELHRVWDIEFESLDNNKFERPAGLRKIDHLALTMHENKLDNWLLFFLSVFEMKKSPLVDVSDPGGVVYSRAVESSEGDLRLNLNGASSQNTFSGLFLAERKNAGLQHMAFSTDDIFETSQILHEAGFQRLSMPENYYNELAMQFELSTEFKSQLQEENILYSRNSSGEFFQIYSQSIWDGFFIEIVERRKGYSGYGARNAPVRLAAQSR